jgi:succinyl-CoA synthetase beta subunit
MASAAGGMEIEEVAAKDPNAILKEPIDPTTGFQPFHARKLAFGLGLRPAQINEAVRFMTGLYRAFVDTDASLCEINPFITTSDGRLFALDAKINFDDNALFRHKDLAALRDPDEEDPREAQAKEHDLSYVGLSGNIGCMVNGAGLAMSTMDMIKLAGGQPANFLDVGGGANQEQVTKAFKIILKSPKVKAIFVNIFGGIMKCDVIANGVVAAAKELGLKVPVIVRLEGTNVELGRKILNESGLAIQAASTMADGAQKVVAAVK